jgi:tRNA-2-methylthio-N6-dimethylallyladenosine synthase
VTTFADLLKRIHDEVPAVGRLRFVTSYPRDFGNDVLEVMAASPRICRYLHVPGQSGSDRILKLMNRGYTRQQYVEFVERARSFLPDVSMAGDIIVGFPTETEVDFDMTRELMRQVRFKNHFIFKYSPRPGTTADDRLPDDVGEAVKRRRNNELLALQADISGGPRGRRLRGRRQLQIRADRQRSRRGPLAGAVRSDVWAHRRRSDHGLHAARRAQAAGPCRTDRARGGDRQRPADPPWTARPGRGNPLSARTQG